MSERRVGIWFIGALGGVCSTAALGLFYSTIINRTYGVILMSYATLLLAYLLLHRSAPQSRQHIAFLHWPDSPESTARSNLRWLLKELRAALPQRSVLGGCLRGAARGADDDASGGG